MKSGASPMSQKAIDHQDPPAEICEALEGIAYALERLREKLDQYADYYGVALPGTPAPKPARVYLVDPDVGFTRN